jgi:hypothetical protein
MFTICLPIKFYLSSYTSGIIMTTKTKSKEILIATPNFFSAGVSKDVTPQKFYMHSLFLHPSYMSSRSQYNKSHYDDYHLLGDDNHHSHRRGNLKSYKSHYVNNLK